MTSKEYTIDKIYHNLVTGFGSVRDVYNQAKKRNIHVLHTMMLNNIWINLIIGK